MLAIARDGMPGGGSCAPPKSLVQTAARSETVRAHSPQEAEEEDTEATRVAGLRGFNKLWHKMGNKVNRSQCFGGPPSALPGDPNAQVCQGVVTTQSLL